MPQVTINLASGQTLSAAGIRLCDEQLVREVTDLKASAIKNMGGVNAGIGFWGSPAWVLGGVAVLGALEGLMSKSGRDAANWQFREAARKFDDLAKSAKYFPVAMIQNVKIPHPDTWKAAINEENARYVGDLSWGQRRDFLTQHGKSKADIQVGNVVRIRESRSYVHDGDDFVGIKTTDGTLYEIRWALVTSYSVDDSA
ncbi:MAG TPA: hypothetical protein VHW66_01220 [Stellaceae bacterium]|jgi:hypothetical protein|nr:hypothetical protein [Stellaceae bacterium]